MKHVLALQGLAAIGRGEPCEAKPAPFSTTPVELEGLLHEAGSALLEQAGLLAGQRERGGVCAALQYLSFRCFCAVDVLHQAASGVSADAVPEGDALWGAIVGAWGSVRSGVNVEGALADLTRWWQGFTVTDVAVAGKGGPIIHDADGKVAMDAALAGMRQQAEWLRGDAAGELASESAAEQLERAASAVEEMRGLLGCALLISGRKVTAAPGLDLLSSLECFNNEDSSMFTGKSRIDDEEIGGAGDVEQWAASVEADATALATSVGAVKRGEAVRIARGLPRMAQTPRKAALAHGFMGGRPSEPLGETSTVMVQVQCEQGWPLNAFLCDMAWDDVELEVKEQVCVKVLGACAAAEACGVSLDGVGVGSFVVVGVGSGSVGDLVVALDGGGCEVVLSACGSVWGTSDDEASESDSEHARVGEDVAIALAEVLGSDRDVDGSSESARGSIASHGHISGHVLSNALQALSEGGPKCCAVAYSLACASMGDKSKCQERDGKAVSACTQLQLAIGNVAERRNLTAQAFTNACRDGDAETFCMCLVLTGDRAVDVHSSDGNGADAAFREACRYNRTNIVRELLNLTGERRIPDSARQEAARFAELKDLI